MRAPRGMDGCRARVEHVLIPSGKEPGRSDGHRGRGRARCRGPGRGGPVGRRRSGAPARANGDPRASRRDGPVSAGGTCRLLRGGDGGWVAINLVAARRRRAARRVDAPRVGRPGLGRGGGRARAGCAAAEAVDRAQQLGIPAAVAAGVERVRRGAGRDSVTPGPPRPPRPVPRCAVVDLSSLVGRAAVRAPARRRRPPGREGRERAPTRRARGGVRPGSGRGSTTGRRRSGRRPASTTRAGPQLVALLAGADVVVSASPPARVRAPRDRPDRQSVERGAVWVSITGYGYDSSAARPRRVRRRRRGGRRGSPWPPEAPTTPSSCSTPSPTRSAGWWPRRRRCTQLRAARAAFVDVCMAGVVNGALAAAAVDPGPGGSQ